ncbi:MAG TPA: helicase-associated domain-containing protein [Candidatus Hydrogenedens sp.]|nr:helicase-associated domain-containing protein [Candidatus Hydrogenedens sp.]HOL20812.1 helicase-associated domain-containing protein [Candidatus Hydrogenedens sp.]
MRYSISLLSVFEGMDQTAFNMALELLANSRGGLTSHYLANRLEITEETVNYLYKKYPKLFFFDLNRIKIVPESLPLIIRVRNNLNSHGDIVSIFKAIQELSNAERRELEQKLRVNRVVGWSSLAHDLVSKIYKTPDSVLEYVASGFFSDLAKEIFDFVWQNKMGILPISQIRQKFSNYSNSEIEDSLEELLNQFVLFELFRFNGQNKLNRHIAILAEIRHHKEKIKNLKEHFKQAMEPAKVRPTKIINYGIQLAEKMSKLLADIAVTPLHLTPSGQISKTDSQRVYQDDSADTGVSVHSYLWMAGELGWTAQVDDTIRVANLEEVSKLTLLERQKAIVNLMKKHRTDLLASVINTELRALKPQTWYSLKEFSQRVVSLYLDSSKYHIVEKLDAWRYEPESQEYDVEGCMLTIKGLYHWSGIVEIGTVKENTYIKINDLGEYLLSNEEPSEKLKKQYSRKNEIIVQPNFEIIAPTVETDPIKLVWIELFTEKKSSAGPVTIYKLTKESFLRGLQRGADHNYFIQSLIQLARNQHIPDILISTIEDWSHTAKRVKIRPVILIETSDSVVIADLLHRKRLSNIFHHVSENQMLYAKGKLLKEIKTLLEKEGFVVE